MQTARADVADFAVHGGRLALARAAFPGRDDWIDLSTGISPWAYPATIDPAALSRLPEPGELAALEFAAAAAFGSVAAQTVAVPGSDIGLRLLGRIIGATEPAVIGPGYSGHIAMWADAAVIPGLDTSCHDAIVLARPNNPDGAVIPFQALASAARALAEKGGWLIVDEAFADATGEAGVAAAGWPATIILRSFGKFFGLAGLRLGFVIAPQPIMTQLRRLLGDWPVSGPAIAIGTAAYQDHEWQTAQRTRLADAATALAAALDAAGISIAGRTACFTLVDTPDATALFRHLACNAILTRPFANHPSRLRIGLPADSHQLGRLSAALHTWRP